MKQIEIKVLITKNDSISTIDTYNATAKYPLLLGNPLTGGCSSIGASVEMAIRNLAPMIVRAVDEEFTKMSFCTSGLESDGQTVLAGNVACPKPTSSLDQETLSDVKDHLSNAQKKSAYEKERKERKETMANINREFSDTYPPVGLRPENVWLSLRLQEIKEAITRYIEADMAVPAKWLREHDHLESTIVRAVPLQVESLETTNKAIR